MISRDYRIADQHGMHARPATALLKLARRFKSEIILKKDGKRVPLKSMLNILALALKHDDTIEVSFEGEDEADAAKALDIFFVEEMKKF
jgi:phosphocarrier protein HPr